MDRHRIVITTLGSLGDLHPYLAVGQELHRRGHEVCVATLEGFQQRVKAAGLEYAPLRAMSVTAPSPEVIRQVFRRWVGVSYLVRELIMPAFAQAYEDTVAAARGADLLIGHPLTFATALVAEHAGIPWLSTQLAPLGLLSAYDPPVLPGLETLRRLGAGPNTVRALLRLTSQGTRGWVKPVDALRTKLDLPDRGHPMFAGGHAPFGTLALFSGVLGGPQPDWPQQTTVTGFAFYQQEKMMDPALAAWLEAGPPPVLFTLGSSAVQLPGAFFEQSAAAARLLGRRALLLGYAPESSNGLTEPERDASGGGLVGGDPDVFGLRYASYAKVFPRVAAVVHQGGIGTTAEALRAGRPMLVMPYGVDQPDNAARVMRLGVARMISRTRYHAADIANALRELLQERVLARSAEVAEVVRKENGAAVAADVAGNVLRRNARR